MENEELVARPCSAGAAPQPALGQQPTPPPQAEGRERVVFQIVAVFSEITHIKIQFKMDKVKML